ncbi:MAG TPA: PhoPQ-activated protein PqaA family protein [Candidatus Hydrogenedentes bacterium]|nr:PhoPQ-activated protein PqaA family protein [Candidatus Hydrogenedentota bacterium]
MRIIGLRDSWRAVPLVIMLLFALVSCGPKTAVQEAPPPAVAPPALAPAGTVEPPASAAALPSPFPVPEEKKTALDKYVETPDPAFAYDTPPAKVEENDAYTARTYHMVSQTWLKPEQVDRTKWEHWLIIIEPKELTQSEALMFIGGGSNKPDAEAPGADEGLARIAVMTKSIVAEIKQIPNQRLKFPDEKDDRYKAEGRTEDEIISYCWDKFILTGDSIWLTRLPMTKAVVRAMDVVQKEQPRVDRFTIVGGSKRGWTTWTVGAVDPRAVAICPAVIDLLNVVKSLDHHYAAYGFWAPAIREYEDMNVLARLHTPEFKALCDIVDPYSYIDRLTMPKYIINSTGDQFFLPDSWQFYFDDLKGEKYLRYVPNTDHGLSTEAYLNLASFHNAIINDTPRPKFAWRMEADGNLTVECETPPTKVLLWQASNPNARDFRLESIGEAWQSTELAAAAPGVYKTAIAAPEKGWTGFMVELEFPNPGFPLPFKFTTGVSVVPQTVPFVAPGT